MFIIRLYPSVGVFNHRGYYKKKMLFWEMYIENLLEIVKFQFISTAFLFHFPSNCELICKQAIKENVSRNVQCNY